MNMLTLKHIHLFPCALSLAWRMSVGGSCIISERSCKTLLPGTSNSGLHAGTLHECTFLLRQKREKIYNNQ